MNTQPGIYGRKLGCTQIFNTDGTVQRVTVVEAGPVVVLEKRTTEKHGYTALVLGLGERKAKHTTSAAAGFFKKAGTTPKRVVKELRCDEAFAAKWEVGQPLKIDEIFEPGQRVDARGTTRGRGFTGVVRRWGFAGAVTTHGTHEYRRHPGSIGTNMTPGRTLPNLKMGGQYGNETGLDVEPQGRARRSREASAPHRGRGPRYDQRGPPRAPGLQDAQALGEAALVGRADRHPATIRDRGAHSSEHQQRMRAEGSRARALAARSGMRIVREAWPFVAAGLPFVAELRSAAGGVAGVDPPLRSNASTRVVVRASFTRTRRLYVAVLEGIERVSA